MIITPTIVETPEQLAEIAAERFANCATEAIRENGRFSVSLAGGNTPKRIYEVLASPRYQSRIEWQLINLFFGDERCVPPTHPDSNYRIVNDALIQQVPIPEKNIYRIAAELEPHAAAQAYEAKLREFFTGQTWPRFDLVLLGMGEDGHTASLFPHSPALADGNAWVLANRVDSLQTFRITLTLPAINHAAHVMFLVAGVAKARRLAEILSDSPSADPLPAQLICPFNGSLEWLVDKEAASFL